ncbi:hypothetical protein LXT23_08800 [Pyxidicoccus sp. QH1ED-7-1]|uniref:Kelch repeat-containing protein n=1 Tax=Pyxidicoccus xibeiensis TaxID=2906759 RepID=UPI0020A7960C|nr:kelch repeat-containing protein [Pyxidicoccus xibeiensis]MCP3137432.1 hypothetical protein [Pyxidicoccus xibeiensis]
MAESRKYHAGVVLLPSGKVLVAGGYNSSGYLSSSSVYDPATGTWTAAAPMPAPRQVLTATLLTSGKVLVAGGENATGRLSSTAVYDPATNTWASAGSFASGVARDALTATLLPSGKVLVAGGGNSSGAKFNVDVYDPVAGTWSVGPNLGVARRNHTATLLTTGQVLVVGGVGSASLATAEVYDPASNTWTAKGGLATARYNHTATRLPSGKVLVVGGRSSGVGVVGTAEVYDPSTGTWSATGALGSARELHTATLLSTGKVLVAGGQNGSALSSAEVYDETSGTWSATTPMGVARYVHVAVPLEGKVLVVGGVGSVSLATAEVYGYDACAGVSCNSAPGPCYEATGTCGNGVCSYAPKASGAACDDGNACTGADACNGAGVCAGSPTSCSSPPGQCYEAAGTCSGGACSYAYKAAGAGCDDGDACTVGEECNGAGGCAGTPVSCNSPPGQCYEAAGTCGSGACSYAPKAAGTACNDGNGGTLNDVCSGTGACAGVPACTTPPSACHDSPGTYANGACTYPVKVTGTACGAGQVCNATGQCLSGCWIGGAYYAAGATNPSVACQECNPGVTTSGWSNKALGSTCAAPSYGTWGSCDGFSDTCDETGSQSRTVTAYACTSSGTCASSSSGETQACSRSTGGTACGMSYDGWGSCGGFSDYCDTSGTQSRTVTASTCGAGACNESSTSTETQACTRAAPNTNCAAPSYGAWSACNFSDACAQTGTQSRTVTSYSYSCATGQCVASTSTETQSCTRNTNGNSCGTPSYGGWSSCSGYSDTCDETGTQSRSVTSYTCSNGTCGSSNGTETQACSRSRDGRSCGTDYGGWGSCEGFSDYCDASGSQSRSVTAYECGGGSCNESSTSTETQACSRVPPGPQPCSSSYGSWSACGGFSDTCDASGTQSRQVTHYTYNCATGQCTPTSSSAETQPCTRTPPGPQHCPTTYGQWGTCTRATPCGQGIQQRTVTSYTYSCATGACVGSTTTETQDCSLPAMPGWTLCPNGTCTTLEDNDNCGACGNACTGPKYNICMGGSCCYTPTNCL